ncbi:NHLP bacteriocin system secretion protein [uncultured Lamprocystis sp.]|jgi:HlyD family secretion protein|uniref:NHLP bacteriocin system secretion protein n=1 Tax=uncultured Lamprocystis sp. TaxID=543132 RepID=UPI0025FBE170|nr:NHLP bacteriocin system secretion protein [uncultured Lamprocystis sp.]
MLFRPQALAKVTDPDQLDWALRIVRPRHVLGFGLVAGVLVAGLIWSMVSTAPVKVGGPGVLLSPAGVSSVTALDAGHVDQFLVQPGDRVAKDQPIALLRQPERLDALQTAEEEARAVRDRHQALQEEFVAQDRHRAELMTRMREASASRVESLETQGASLGKRREGEAHLREKGQISGINLFETETQLAQVKHDLATARNRITELALEHEQQADKRHQELVELRIQAQNLTRHAENLRREYERKRQVLAITSGIVAELEVDLDDPVSSGQTIARLLVDDAAGEDTRLTAIAYLPAAVGKKVKSGMPARVSPSTVKVELDGYILGQVVRVAELPASREAMTNRLENAALADEILKGGTPIEIEVALQRAADTPSGYAWSSGKGPLIRIEPGTLARTEVVVERVHIISLLFPAMDYVFGWIKSR